MATSVASPITNGADRRKSGRASRKPIVFSQEVHEGSVVNSAKRKRTSAAADAQHEDDEEMESEADEDESLGLFVWLFFVVV